MFMECRICYLVGIQTFSSVWILYYISCRRCSLVLGETALMSISAVHSVDIGFLTGVGHCLIVVALASQ